MALASGNLAPKKLPRAVGLDYYEMMKLLAGFYFVLLSSAVAAWVPADMDRAVLHGYCANCDLTRVSLRSVRNDELVGAVLQNSNFSGAYLVDVNLHKANLRLSNFSGAKANGANFSNASLDHANFSNALLINANFSGADLRHADFRSADISGANFTGADLRSAKMPLGQP